MGGKREVMPSTPRNSSPRTSSGGSNRGSSNGSNVVNRGSVLSFGSLRSTHTDYTRTGGSRGSISSSSSANSNGSSSTRGKREANGFTDAIKDGAQWVSDHASEIFEIGSAAYQEKRDRCEKRKRKGSCVRFEHRGGHCYGIKSNNKHVRYNKC